MDTKHTSIITLGITGGIGSGKSVLCRMLNTLDIPVYDTDSEAKKLYDTDPLLREQMIQLLGAELYDTPDGRLDRERLASIIFCDSHAMQSVVSLVHPAVRRDIERWRSLVAHNGVRLCALESALLLSSPALYAMVDYSVVVVADYETRIVRALKRDNSTREAIEARMRHQMSQEAMCAEAHYIIRNTNEPLLPQLDALLKAIS